MSLLQRALGIGYGRAARLIDFMAEDGIVGAYNGSNAREVLYTPEQWEELKGSPSRSTAQRSKRLSDRLLRCAACERLAVERFGEPSLPSATYGWGLEQRPRKPLVSDRNGVCNGKSLATSLSDWFHSLSLIVPVVRPEEGHP